ncbi:MAG: hypothetical protein ACE5FN_01555 [Leptospirillia bacterium]
MRISRRINSTALVRDLQGGILSECYVMAIGFKGLTALSENPLPVGDIVSLELVFVTADGGVEGETVMAGVMDCGKRRGAHMVNMVFTEPLSDDQVSPLAAFIRREMGRVHESAPEPQSREAVAGMP